jgi:hypothetical protein
MAVNRLVVAACKAFALRFGKPSTVYYPGCGNDASPSVAFPDAQIIYLDPVQAGLKEIQTQFPQAVVVIGVAEDALAGAQYDLVLDIHSHAPFDMEIRDLRRSGHLLIATKRSDHAFDSPRLELAGAMQPTASAMLVDTENLDRYKEEDQNHPKFSFSNRRLIKAPFYVFNKIA